MNSIARLVLFVLAGVMSCSVASADPVAITSGFINLEIPGVFGNMAMQLAGDRGFSYQTQGGMSFSDSGHFEPLVPGTSASLHGGASGTDAGGILQFEGVTYSDIGGFNSPANVGIGVDANVPLPSVVSPNAVVTAPFSLNLDFSWTAPDGSASIRQSFFGSGSAVVDLAAQTGFDFPTWQITGLRGELTSAPTPEPSTLLLMGAAGALAMGRRIRRFVQSR